MFDVDAVRARFPALTRTIDGQPVAYLDGPGGSQVPQEVIDAIAGYLRDANANQGGPFATSAATDAIVWAAREAAADFTRATPDEIAFGPNMTTLNFLLAHAACRTFARGDEIVVTDLDHDANVSPWLCVAPDHGLVVRHAPIRTGDGTLDYDALEGLLSARTRVVACTLASNAFGSMPDARRVADAAHRVGALAWFDAVHYAPHNRIDRDALGADVLVCSPYKFFGPHQGLAVIRRDLAETWPADRVRPADETPPGHRFETGTQAHELLAGTTAAIDYLASLGSGGTRRERLDDAYDAIGRYEATLTQAALARLAEIPGLELYGIAEPNRTAERTATFTFRIDGHEPRAIAEELGRRGLFVWHGNYYALAPMVALGLEERGGAVRAGFLHYSTLDEVDRLADALERIAAS